MDFPARFFLLDSPAPSQLLGSTHDSGLVALSVLVAVVTSYVALALSDRASEAATRQLRIGALAAGALSLGGGVWTMHFIGMLAFQICGQVAYDPVWTLGSMVPSLGAAWVALRALTRRQVRAGRLLAAGVWMGSGIGLMHYGGMAAVRSSAQLRYDPAWFATSIVVAVALATLALALHHGLKRRLPGYPRGRTLLAAGLLGGAISGMHYTAMGAARFIGVAQSSDVAPLHLELALGVALMALILSVVAVGFNAVLVQRQLTRDRVRSELRLQAMVDTAVDGVVRMDANGVIVAANRAAEAIFGLPAAALLGQSRSDLVPALVPALQQRGDDFAGVIRIEARRADGQPLLLRLAIGHSDVDGERQSVAFITDITEIARRQAELEGVQTALRRALVVVEFDLDGHILSANDAFLALTVHSADSLFGRHHRILCLPEEVDDPAYEAHWAALRRGEFLTGDFERVGHDGRHIWIRATYNPILDVNGRPTRVIKFVSDLTERHVMEQDLRQAKRRAEQAAAAKSTFLANMSHEIRTPMNAIIGFSEMALDGNLNGDAREHLQVIHRSARSLLGLLNDILDTAKLDHGAVELEQHDFSPRRVCADVIATLRVQAERKGLALRMAVADDVPDFLRGDPLRLQQILLNLVGNAIKFTEQGSVMLAVERLPTGGVTVSVLDTGIGIPADRLSHIFDPFAQADATMTRRFGGTGLGTTIARQLVQLMGGEIGVNSTVGEGSCFWLHLPLGQGQAPAIASPPEQQVVLPPLRILAADDVPENLRLLQLKLGAMGHTVELARDGLEALARMQAGGLDLALLDVQMPHLDGLQACRLLRAHEQAVGATALPVLALTASASDDDRSLTGDAGMDGFVTKPIDWPVLLGEMARVLRVAPVPVAAAVSPAPATALPALPEAVTWPPTLARWGGVDVWRDALRPFLASALQGWATTEPGPAWAHRLRGACANFGLDALAALCEALEHPTAPDTAAWQALHERLVVLHEALLAQAAEAATGTTGPVPEPQPTPPWPGEAARALCEALARGELPDAPYRAVLEALPATQRDRLREAMDGFDFDAARAVIEQNEMDIA